MSFFVMAFYWIAIPALLALTARWLLRRAETQWHKGLIFAVAEMAFAGLLWFAVGEKWLLDRQVRELCAKDGNVKVYETVRLPAEKFNSYGQINFYRPVDGENTLGPEYIYKWDIYYYKKGEPAVNGAQEIFRETYDVAI